MSRLVDVNKLKEAIIKEYLRGKKTLMEVIDEQPTAFDLDNVVEQLENYLFEKYCIEGDTTIDEIIKGGGIK